MKVDNILLEPVENGVIVDYWDKGEQKRKIFSNSAADQKKLFEFLKDKVKLQK